MSEGDRHEKLRMEFHQIFQSDGLSEVDLRDRVLDAFLNVDRHVGVDELAGLLMAQGVKVDPSKVQRFLDLFTAYGIARKQSFDGLADVWEHLHLGAHHDHMVCVQCGRILEFESPQIESLQEQMARLHGFRPAHHRLVIYGVCEACDVRRSAGFPLAHAAQGELVQVQRVRGGGAFGRRLEDMGLNAGSTVEVMRNDGDGPIIVARGDTRLGVDRTVASRVLVVPVQVPPTPEPDQHRRRHRRRGGHDGIL